ncbi:uncharacterized protein LOC117124907 [Anneissia japonica]|uniref:uncharacterized protein LOC117124907 n=1 Tax=Anneissia japonica TaxID=1529436 RepID=UPI0014259C26|nr:uncharacterized protein LOC117124907 [Anneissia japonica]
MKNIGLCRFFFSKLVFDPRIPPIGECFSDQDLLFICDNLEPESWRRLGLRLGQTWTDINRIANNNRLVEDRIMELLVTWRNGQSINQIPIMIHTLRLQKLAGLAQRISARYGYSNESGVAPTQINQPQVQTPVEAKCFSDQDLLFICDNLEPESWRRLGLRLGQMWTDINRIANNNRLVEDRIIELLVTWRDGQSINQIPIMIHTLRLQKLAGLAQRVSARHGYSDESEVAPTQINQPQVPTPVEGYLAELDMLFISERLGHDWKDLGIYLGMKRSEINLIQVDFSPPVVDACIGMLIRWRERQRADVNHLETIKHALDQLERMDIIKELNIYYQENYQK